jgi:hypothetical protein
LGENLVKTYPIRNVIVISHYVLKVTCGFSSQGNSIYQRFKVYPNFKLMLGGHVPDSAAEAIKTTNYNGNTINTVLFNYQGRQHGGDGLLRIYEFDPRNNAVSVKTYSPYLNTYETDSNSKFTMKVSLIKNTNVISATTQPQLKQIYRVIMCLILAK